MKQCGKERYRGQVYGFCGNWASFPCLQLHLLDWLRESNLADQFEKLLSHEIPAVLIFSTSSLLFLLYL